MLAFLSSIVVDGGFRRIPPAFLDTDLLLFFRFGIPHVEILVALHEVGLVVQ